MECSGLYKLHKTKYIRYVWQVICKWEHIGYLINTSLLNYTQNRTFPSKHKLSECESLTAEVQSKGRRDALSEMPRHALKCLLYYNNFFLIGLDQKYSIYIRHLIGRRLRVDSERSAKLPDKVFLCVSYYDKVVRSENYYLKKDPRIKIGKNCNTSHLMQCKRLSCRRWQLDINI